MILAIIVLLVALFAILWSPPNVEHFELWLIIGLALAILLGGGLPNPAGWFHRRNPPPPSG